MSKKQKRTLCICLVLGFILGFMLLFIFGGGLDGVRRTIRNIRPISHYSWDEYQAMSNEEKDAFFQRFDSVESFEAWKSSVQPEETLPEFRWDKPGKQPSEYTWEEYQVLTPEEQEAFYQWFESENAFMSWLETAKPEESTLPDWNKPGKLPSEYTWEEYQALGAEDRDAFSLWFASETAFEDWMNQAKPDESEPTEPIWSLSGKTPKDYTWEEYQVLSPEQQDAFYLWFGSLDAFEAWMKAAKPEESEPELESWDESGKQPDEYTWKEYQALTPEEQEMFYQWFASRDEFEKWMYQAEAADGAE